VGYGAQTWDAPLVPSSAGPPKISGAYVCSWRMPPVLGADPERALRVVLTGSLSRLEWPLFAPSCPTRSIRRRDQVDAKRRLGKSVCEIPVAVLRNGLVSLDGHVVGAGLGIRWTRAVAGARGRRVTVIRAFATSEFERQAIDLDH
jgi:hypothetical protein